MIKTTNLVAIFILLSVIVFGMYYKIRNSTKVVEGISNNNNIILMGDSIFANDIYVRRGESVGDQLQDKHGNVLVVAQDNAVIDDLDYQFSKIPSNFDSGKTKVIVSVGGNDLLNQYMMSDVSKTNHVNTIFNRYTSNLNNLRNNSDCEFILSNIYYPRSPSYERFYDIIEIWNDKLNKYAKNNGLKILNIDDKVDKKHYFTHDIEPSASGSSVIIDNILNL
tara:strand:- start:9 stop:674 length:666 start_codon:yes stop_codon:yes gene_type:complete